MFINTKKNILQVVNSINYFFQGKVVIRPIAFKPAAPSPAQLAHGINSPSGPIAGVGGRPPHDPRYTSTPALGRDVGTHYGSKFKFN